MQISSIVPLLPGKTLLYITKCVETNHNFGYTTAHNGIRSKPLPTLWWVRCWQWVVSDSSRYCPWQSRTEKSLRMTNRWGLVPWSFWIMSSPNEGKCDFLWPIAPFHYCQALNDLLFRNVSPVTCVHFLLDLCWPLPNISES